MAALSDAAFPRLVDLRQLRSDDLEPLLAEEIAEWERKLDWDFHSSAYLVERFVAMRSLAGYGLIAANRVVGYTYYVCEDRKGLIGDLYVMREYRSEEAEYQLFEPVMESLAATPWVRRVESQLMMLTRSVDRVLPCSEQVKVYPRTFMEVSLEGVSDLPAKDLPGISYHTWSERFQGDAAQLIASAYRGHIDSDINDQYRSPGGARRFLLNIIQYPGCGAFFEGASQLAMTANHRVCGICLTSIVRTGVGHITQVCVGPEVRGRQVGYELLRRSLEELRRCGCHKATLTVTTANETAIRLYRQMGFVPRQSFAAIVWDGL